MNDRKREDGFPRNHQWRRDGAGLASDPLSDEQLTALRTRASESGAELAFRSCWLCNRAHDHFLDGEWGGWVLCCLMGCGAYYFDRADITDYSGAASPDAPKETER